MHRVLGAYVMRRRVLWGTGVVLVVLILAAGTACFLVRPTDSVRLNIVADSGVVPLTLPGEASESCGERVCRSVLRVDKSDQVRSVSATPDDALPQGVRLAYWGCGEGPGSAACTVRPDRDTTICVTTTGPADVERNACGTRPGTPVAEAPGTLSVIFNTKWKIKLFGNFDGSCASGGALGKRCEISIKPGKIYYLRAQFEKAADPYPRSGRSWDFHYVTYEGCNSGMGHADAITCVVFGGSKPAMVCVASGDPAEQKPARECLAYRRAGTS
ncbi:hypothetical protein ABZT47_03455 [Sphaerisporangium sp. NPDC005289]|uniref:hypothetical protein n=1 Tax=Sphaerisporangium sp. NPDC005289 TaxID=3155247 RepID=UPI0033BB6BE0